VREDGVEEADGLGPVPSAVEACELREVGAHGGWRRAVAGATRCGEEALVGQDDELDAGPGKRQPPDADRGPSGEVSGERRSGAEWGSVRRDSEGFSILGLKLECASNSTIELG
jgi:hypothetical protein